MGWWWKDECSCRRAEALAPPRLKTRCRREIREIARTVPNTWRSKPCCRKKQKKPKMDDDVANDGEKQNHDAHVLFTLYQGPSATRL